MNNECILVVGGAGYIGSHMVLELLQTGREVIVLDNLSTGHREMVQGGRFIEGDLNDAGLLDRIFSEHRIDAVMHFAAFALVGESVVLPLKYYRNNVSATTELLQAMVRHDVKRFIFSSTAAVYGEPKTVPIVEDHPCQPTNPYGASKIAVERMLQDCDSAYGIRYVSLRYFNAAGAHASARIGEKHQPETHLIPLVLKVAAKENEHINIFGTDYDTPDGTCVRDYVHVSDLVQAHLLALEALMTENDSAIYNLGNSRGYSVREVIELARKITGHPIPTCESGRRPGDPATLIASAAKIKSELGWKPKYEHLEQIVDTAWRWHRKQTKKKDPVDGE